MNIYEHLFEYNFQFFEYIPRRGIAGSYDNPMFNLLRKHQTVPLQLHNFTFPPDLPFVFNQLQLRFHQCQSTALVKITNNFLIAKSNDLFSQMTYSLHFKMFMALNFQTDTLLEFLLHHWSLILFCSLFLPHLSKYLTSECPRAWF